MSGNGINSDFSCYMHQIIQHFDYMNVLSPEVNTVISLKRPQGEYRMEMVQPLYMALFHDHIWPSIYIIKHGICQGWSCRVIFIMLSIYHVMCLIFYLFVIYVRSYILYIYGLGEEWGGGGAYTFCTEPQLVSNHYMFRCECHIIFHISILKLIPRGSGVEYRWCSIITERVQYRPIKIIAIQI